MKRHMLHVCLKPAAAEELVEAMGNQFPSWHVHSMGWVPDQGYWILFELTQGD